MSRLLFLCVGNAFQSPLLAALYNAEVMTRAAPGIAFSAGLSNRREAPPTTPFLLEAVAREVGDLPAVLEALKDHQPKPLKDLEFVPVDGISYLYDPARSRGHLAQDARAIQTWLEPAPNTPLMQLAVKDSGYETWVAQGRPRLQDPTGQLVVDAYRREVAALRALMRALLPSEDGTTPSPVVLAAPAPPRVVAPPPVVQRVQQPPVVQRVQSPLVQRVAPLVQRASPPRVPAQAPITEPSSPPRVAPKRTVVRPSLLRNVGPEVLVRPEVIVRPVVTASDDEVPASVVREVPQILDQPEAAPKRRRVVASKVVASNVAASNVAASNVAASNVAASNVAASNVAASKVAPTEAAPTEAASDVGPTIDPPTKVASTIDPPERAEVLEDVRAWIRAALPVRRPTLSRYGLLERAEEHFGSWSKAVSAAGIPLAAEPLWQLPARDPELSFDILIEALPDAIVARLCSVTLAKVRRRRRDNGAPDPTRQLHRRVLATNQLEVASDADIAAQLGVSVGAIAEVREAERLAGSSSDDARAEGTSTPS